MSPTWLSLSEVLVQKRFGAPEETPGVFPRYSRARFNAGVAYRFLSVLAMQETTCEQQGISIGTCPDTTLS